MRITQFVGTGGYIPPDDGTLTRTNDESKWIYKAFKEPKAEKHPEIVSVYIAPFIAGSSSDSEPVGEAVEIKIQPVFKITSFYYPGPGNPIKFANANDKNNGINFVIWKYGVGGGYSMEFDNAETNGNIAFTHFYPFADNETFLSDTALNTENITASVIGHEAVHRGQGYYWVLVNSEADKERPAYKWELDNKSVTGIDENNNAYLEETQEEYDDYNE